MDTFQSQVQREFDGLRSEVATLRVALAKTQTSQPRAKLPDPEKFTGNTYKFDTWLPSIRHSVPAWHNSLFCHVYTPSFYGFASN